jgi:hypothetical protein
VSLVRTAACASWVRIARRGRWPLQVLPERCLPTLSSLPGATPAHPARRGLKPCHIHPDLRHAHCRSAWIDPRKRFQEFDSTGKGELRRDYWWRGAVRCRQGHLLAVGRCIATAGLQRRLNSLVEGRSLCVEKVDRCQRHRQWLAMLVVHDAGKGWLEQGNLCTHASLRQCGHRGRLCTPSDERLQHGPPRDTHASGNHGSELDIGPFQDAWDPVALAHPLLDQLRPVGGEITHITLPLGRAETRLQPAQAPQFGSPAGIVFGGLPPGDVLPLGRSHQKHRTGAFKPIDDRFPILPCVFHSDMGHGRLG